MRYLLLFILVPTILVMSYGGCNDECINCPNSQRGCTKSEDVNESMCIAEEYQNICNGSACSSGTYSFNLAHTDCEIIDCNTEICEASSVIPTDDPNFSMLIDQPGTITILGLDEISNLPFGTIEVDDVEAGEVIEDFDCFFVTP